MDRLIYTAMTGAKHILAQQSTVAHNLANATSTGFKAQVDTFRAVPIVGPGIPTRAFVVDATIGADMNAGAIQHTGRSLDVAIQNKGWLSVERPNGKEGYTRNGALKMSENGILQTANGLNVLGDGGPISIPPDVEIAIASDGTVSAILNGVAPSQTNILGRLKLVNPDESTLIRSEEGLFITNDGNPADADANVKIVGGALESSNVNVVDAMVNMISLARQFEMQMKLIQSAENNANKAGQLLNMS